MKTPFAVSGKFKVVFAIIIALTCFAAHRAAADDIYTPERIAEKMRNPGSGAIAKSGDIATRATTLYRKEKQPAAAIALFREAAALYPSLQTYYELGNALCDTRNFDEAMKAYGAALLLDTTGSKKHLVYYNMACAESLANRVPNALIYLEMALRYNYYAFAHLRADGDLAHVRAVAAPTVTDLIARYDNTARLAVLLIGRWENAPMTAERSNASYAFNKDGTFTWEAGTVDLTTRAISQRGRWRVDGSTLTLVIQERSDRVGGRIAVSTEPHNAGERMLIDYREKTTRPARALILSHPISHVTPDPDGSSPAQGRQMVLINNLRHWKTDR